LGGYPPSLHERMTNRFLLLNSVNGPKFSDGGMKPAGITRNELDCRNRPYVEGGGRIPPPPSGRGGGPRSGNKWKGGRGGTPPHLLTFCRCMRMQSQPYSFHRSQVSPIQGTSPYGRSGFFSRSMGEFPRLHHSLSIPENVSGRV